MGLIGQIMWLFDNKCHASVSCRWDDYECQLVKCVMMWQFISINYLHVIVVQVSFAPVRDGSYTGRLTVTAVPASSQSAQHCHPTFQICVALTAAADVAIIQVLQSIQVVYSQAQQFVNTAASCQILHSLQKKWHRTAYAWGLINF